MEKIWKKWKSVLYNFKARTLPVKLIRSLENGSRKKSMGLSRIVIHICCIAERIFMPRKCYCGFRGIADESSTINLQSLLKLLRSPVNQMKRHGWGKKRQFTGKGTRKTLNATKKVILNSGQQLRRHTFHSSDVPPSDYHSFSNLQKLKMRENRAFDRYFASKVRNFYRDFYSQNSESLSKIKKTLWP